MLQKTEIQVLKTFQRNNPSFAKKFIKKSKILFKGTNGIGINYYIGKK